MKINLKLHLTTTLLVTLLYGNAQQQDRPKLIVGIVVDQMRAEYLYRFQDNFSNNGFKKLLEDGFNVKNTHYNYVPTATGPGHASIYTGTTPANHGIVANNWYSRVLKRKVYCAEDFSVKMIHGDDSIDDETGNYSRSPKNLLSHTITDELKLFSNGKSKVVGISLKDRGAIFPAGHIADYAFWYHSQTGHFVTSNYYSNKLPDWLINFNKNKKADSLLNTFWKPMLPITQYRNSGEDDSPFEKVYKDRQTSTFLYNLKQLRKDNGNFNLLAETPMGNTLLTELAMETIVGENLGQDSTIDFLTISYSATDYIGHNFGIRSKELEDTYIRMDKEIERLLLFLDKKVGENQYLLFLTADHGASDNPPFLTQMKLPGNFYSSKSIKEKLEQYLFKKYGYSNNVAYIDKTQIYLSDSVLSNNTVLEDATMFLKQIEGVREIIAPIQKNDSDNSFNNFVRKGYHHKKSGDIFIHFNSGWMPQRSYGTTHGNAYNSDTHVPLLWYGWNIPVGETVALYEITQIAPTISFLLDIPLPNASNKGPIMELFK